MKDEIENLSTRIKDKFHSVVTKITLFPSGAVMLDLRLQSETYVLEYRPSIKGIGVSRLSTAGYGWEGYERSFEDLQSAEVFLFQVLAAELSEVKPSKPTKAR